MIKEIEKIISRNDGNISIYANDCQGTIIKDK